MYLQRLIKLLGFAGSLGLAILYFCCGLVSPQNAGAEAGPSPAAAWPLLVGSGGGLYGMNRYGAARPLWTGGEVRKILQSRDGWTLLSDQGIFVSADLMRWEDRSGGLPVKTIKRYQEGEKSFLSVVQEIKDLEVNPADNSIMVCATKDRVFLSRDGGRTWQSLGMPAYRTNGIKAAAAAYLPAADTPELTVFLSHSTYGIHYLHPDRPNPQWTELNAGLEKLETTGNPDEVSDIAVSLGPGGAAAPDIYAAQTFRRRLYRLDWEKKRFDLVWSDASEFGSLDSIDIGEGSLRFVREGAVIEVNRPESGGTESLPAHPPLLSRKRTDILDLLRLPRRQGIKPSCVVIREHMFRPGAEPVNLSELWLLDEASGEGGPGDGGIASGGTAGGAAAGREGLYLPVNHAMESASLKPYLDIISSRNLNMVVIDMKDDYGRLRFNPQNPAIAEKGRVFRPVDIDGFLQTMKSRGIYTAARVVVFKDPELARKEGERFALWDGRTGKAWAGYYDRRRPKPEPGSPPEEGDPGYTVEILPAEDPRYEIVRTYYDERWVDPYSEEVWDYIADVARELHERGFDEIQFDYIRFPTDGDNLADARYRWREPGMDMESAMLSFLRHIRSRLDGPISIDIYGANGWYRTGARTGQEVELLAPHVDVICPMYYPSHFEQDFLAQPPAELRPYRIYFQGVLRTRRIARGRIIVRPYVQAFFLNVSYDRQFYGPDYVRRETEAVRAAGAGGLTYWNNSGRYDDIPRIGSSE
jgi:hypothetical protein